MIHYVSVTRGIITTYTRFGFVVKPTLSGS